MMFRSRSLQHARGLGLRRFREPAQMHEQLVDVNGVRRKGRDYGEVICGGWAIRKMRLRSNHGLSQRSAIRPTVTMRTLRDPRAHMAGAIGTGRRMSELGNRQLKNPRRRIGDDFEPGTAIYRAFKVG